MTAAEATVKEGGVIIMLASSDDGTGGDHFYHQLADEPDIDKTMDTFLSRNRNETVPDQWQTQILCRVLKEHRVIFVTRPEMQKIIEEMKMEYAPDLDTALKMAGAGSVTVIPDGVSVCICN